MQRQGTKPNAVAYGALIRACGKGQMPELALEALQAMVRQGALPTFMQRGITLDEK